MNQITEDYVSYEIAKLLKEKGFTQFTNMGYMEGVLTNVSVFQVEHNPDRFEAYAYTHQMALKWLREVHKLHIYAKPYWPQGDMRNKMSWQGFIVDLNTINGDSQCYADSFEESVENRIKFALENLI